MFTSDVQDQHSTAILSLVTKCATVGWHNVYSATHRFVLTAVIHHSTVNVRTHTYINTTRPNRSVTYSCVLSAGRSTNLLSLQCSTRHSASIPLRKAYDQPGWGFELQSILGNTKCAKPISTPPCAGHTRSQSEYIEPYDVNTRSGVGETPFRFLSSLALVLHSRLIEWHQVNEEVI